MKFSPVGEPPGEHALPAKGGLLRSLCDQQEVEARCPHDLQVRHRQLPMRAQKELSKWILKIYAGGARTHPKICPRVGQAAFLGRVSSVCSRHGHGAKNHVMDG